MKTVKTALALLIVAGFVTFVVQNLGEAPVTFLVWEGSYSLAIPIVGAYLIGGLTARTVARFFNGLRKSRKLEKRAMKAAEKKRQPGDLELR